MHSPDFQALLDRIEALEKRVNNLESKNATDNGAVEEEPEAIQ